MRDTDNLFARRQEALVQRFGELERLQELNPLVDQVVTRVVEADTNVSTPGLVHIKTALRRVVGDIPTGKAFASSFYDKDDAVVSDFDNPEDLETSTARQPVRSRVFVIADNETEGGKIGKKIDEWLDGKKEAKSKVILHTMTSTGAISFDIHSITFAAVKVEGGGTYCYEIVPNDNKGKIIATEAMQNEFGDVRERFGYIDNCPVKAVELSAIDRQFVGDELKRILEALPKPVQPEKTSKLEKVYKKLGAISTRFTHTVGDRSNATETSSADYPPVKK